METKRLITYSLLAHINNTGTLVKGLLDIYVPIVKNALSEMNNKGIFSGKNISEIQNVILDLFSIEIPLPVLKNILQIISKEVNDSENQRFILYKDNAFAIKNYTFDEFDVLIEEKKHQIDNIEELFKEFCEINKVFRKKYKSIFSFIEIHKESIASYLSDKRSINSNQDFSIEAQFVSFFKRIPEVYTIIQDLYLGSILSTYIEFSTNFVNQEIELLLDTNFIISLIDLNTPESTQTCRKLLEIAKHNGYKLTVLNDTIEETQRLLLRRSEHFNESFLIKKINTEDIYNACDRRKLNKTDLENIADNLQEELNKYGIYVIPHTEKYQNLAKFSKEYTTLKKYRNNDRAALHDATAIYYVRNRRNNKRFKAFEKVTCWFVNNAISSKYEDFSQNKEIFVNGYLPEIIKVDTLLNILWLSNPNVKISSQELIDNGITVLISATLNKSLPRTSVIRELDDNIQKYAHEELTDKQIILVATRIANKQITNIEELNKLANIDKEKFVKRLQKEAERQEKIEKERIERIEKFMLTLQNEKEKLEKERKSIAKNKERYDELSEALQKAKESERIKENKLREIKRDLFIKTALKKWRKKSWIELTISLLILFIGILIIFYLSDWDFQKVSQLYENLQKNIIFGALLFILGVVFTSIVVKSLFNKYRNHSNINAFIESLDIPDDMKEI